MPITWLDFLLLGVMLVSGLLAMIRGFMREVLSIAAWAAAAVATVLLYNRLLPMAKANISSDMLAAAAVIGGVFLITLLVVSILTVRVSDMILDSRIGALDRTLGFLFGLARGLIIVVVAFLFFSWLVPGNKQPEGVRNAKSRVVLEDGNGCKPRRRRSMETQILARASNDASVTSKSEPDARWIGDSIWAPAAGAGRSGRPAAT